MRLVKVKKVKNYLQKKVCTVVESTVVEQPTAALGYFSEGLESPIRVATFGTNTVT